MPDVIFNGPEGRLEGRYQPNPDGGTSPIALILHPHPLYGGTMNNKIVYLLFHAFAKRGFSALRFNFRGVGKSQGTFDAGQGELADAASALDWLQLQNPNAKACWIAGFSFGAWIGMQLLMRRPEIAGFISISPPANLFDFGFLSPCPSSGLIVHGAADQHVPLQDVQKLSDRLKNQKDIKVLFKTIASANHFYDDRTNQLDTMVGDYLDAALKG
ncbi:MAG: alpha/beta fold hydrolase [Alphaproteobacteria bacterium]|nr:alpha/beta fold hydrolase [Alphaproteobacteria bacterium]